MHRVAVVAPPGLVLFDLATPLETFGRARDPDGARLYDPVVVGAATVTTSAGALRPAAPLDTPADTIVVPGREDPLAPNDRDVLDALRDAATRGTRLVSICTGTFTLAEAGLLDGRRVTTHWRAAGALAARYPRVDVDPDVLYVDDGDVLTSAGAVAGVDLCLHVVMRDFGAAIAAATARLCVLPLHREGGQAQFIARDVPRDRRLAPLLGWIEEHLHDDLTVDDLAAAAGTSSRTLYRQFEAHLGCTPAGWLRSARVRRARELLEGTTAPLDVIADRVGFGSPDTLRRHFHRHVGTSPSRYRRRFIADAEEGPTARTIQD